MVTELHYLFFDNANESGFNDSAYTKWDAED